MYASRREPDTSYSQGPFALRRAFERIRGPAQSLLNFVIENIPCDLADCRGRDASAAAAAAAAQEGNLPPSDDTAHNAQTRALTIGGGSLPPASDRRGEGRTGDLGRR